MKYIWDNWLKSSWAHARGTKWYLPKSKKCFICNRQEDYLFEFTILVPAWINDTVKYVCNHHPCEWYDLFTGKRVNFSGIPWYIDIVQQVVLNISILSRFIYFLVYGFLWNCILTVYWFVLTNKHTKFIFKKNVNIKD